MAHPLEGKICVAMCANYIYSGLLKSVTPDAIVLSDPTVVYETGPWTEENWRQAERLPTSELYIERSACESMYELNREVAREAKRLKDANTPATPAR